MLGQVKQRIRALERKFAEELAQIEADELANEYVGECYRAKGEGKPMPEPFMFCMNAAKAKGYFRRTTHRALIYLEKCKKEGEMPDALRLVRKLLLKPVYS